MGLGCYSSGRFAYCVEDSKFDDQMPPALDASALPWDSGSGIAAADIVSWLYSGPKRSGSWCFSCISVLDRPGDFLPGP